MAALRNALSRARRIVRIVRIDLLGILRAVHNHGRGYPFATNLSLVSIPIGLLAVVIGPDISRGFTAVLGDRPEPIYIWGVLLLLGGFNVAIGIGQRLPSRERAGLYVLAVAYAFYGVCVILGLGWGGMVTGPIFVVLAISCVQRAAVLLAAAKSLQVLIGRDGSGD
jgi:hypothetical protein